MNIETTVVTRNGNQYVVSDIEIVTVNVDEELARRVADRTDVDVNDVAIVIATIEKSRATSSDDKRKEEEKIYETCLRDGLTTLLIRYTADELCEMFEEMKYFEIKRILESDDPVGAIRESDAFDNEE